MKNILIPIRDFFRGYRDIDLINMRKKLEDLPKHGISNFTPLTYREYNALKLRGSYERRVCPTCGKVI